MTSISEFVVSPSCRYSCLMVRGIYLRVYMLESECGKDCCVLPGVFACQVCRLFALNGRIESGLSTSAPPPCPGPVGAEPLAAGAVVL